MSTRTTFAQLMRKSVSDARYRKANHAEITRKRQELRARMFCCTCALKLNTNSLRIGRTECSTCRRNRIHRERARDNKMIARIVGQAMAKLLGAI